MGILDFFMGKDEEDIKEESKTPTILIVEDDEMLVKMYELQFKKSGFNVLVRMEGEGGLKAIQEEKPDIVLLDIMMPGMNGLDVLDYIRNEDVSDIKIVIFSNMPEGKEEALKNGVDEFLVKSDNTPQQVLEKVKEVLARNKI